MATDTDTAKDLAFYRQCMRINQGNLAQECSDHPLQHAKIARQAVLASSRLSAMTMRVASDFGARARKARTDLSQLPNAPARITDLAIRAEVERQPHANALPEECAALKQVMGEWEALREASKDRGFMISKLVDIWIAGLLDPSEPRMSKSGARAQAHADTDGAPLPPSSPVSDRAAVVPGYDESRAAINQARQQNRAVMPKPTTRKREGL